MTRKLATYADLLEGENGTSPAALPRHSKVQGATRRCLGGPFDDDDGRGGPGGWWIFVEVDVALSEHEIVRPTEVAPNWVCEILSPSTSARDRVTKRALYARAGIPHYWLIDPEARVLEALALRDRVWVEVGAYDDSATARIAPFEAVELEVGRLFVPKEADE